MAMEHFDDKVVPGLIRRHQQASNSGSPGSGSGSGSPMVNLGPSRLLSSPGAAALFVASSPSTSSGNSIANPAALAPHQKVMRDEFVALKKKMSEVMGKHKSARKEVCTLVSVRLLSFYFGGSKLVRFLAKNIVFCK